MEIHLFCSDSPIPFSTVRRRKNKCEEARDRPISYLYLGVDVEQGEKSVHVYKGLSGLSVHCTQEV